MTTNERTIQQSLFDSSVIIDTNDRLTLTEDFRTDWQRRIDQVTDDPIQYLSLLLDTDPELMSVAEDGDGVSVQDTSGSGTRTVGEWPSETALVADIAAFVALGEWLPEFEELSGAERDELVARLRVFLEACPDCGGELEHASGEGESDVPSMWCVECGATVI